MKARFALWLRQLLVSIDQRWAVWIGLVTFVLLARGKCPSADETISSHVGRAEMAGKPWGIAWARRIDRLFVLLGEEPGHCRRNVETAFLGKAPVA